MPEREKIGPYYWTNNAETPDTFWINNLTKCSSCKNQATHYVSRGTLQTKMCQKCAEGMRVNFECVLKPIKETPIA